MILRGRRIEEYTPEELVALYKEIGNELPDVIEKLTEEHAGKLEEMDDIETELMRRDEKL